MILKLRECRIKLRAYLNFTTFFNKLILTLLNHNIKEVVFNTQLKTKSNQ